MALAQSRYRFGVVELAEATHSFLAAENVNVSRAVGVGGQFLARMGIQASGGVAHNNVAAKWQYEHQNSQGVVTAWADITQSSAVVRTGSTTVFANQANCTNRLGGTGTFESSGAGCTHTGAFGGNALDIVSNGRAETEIGLQLIAADVDMGDKIRLRVVMSNGTLLNSYDAFPEITVLPQTLELLAQQSRGPGEFTTTRDLGARPPSSFRLNFPIDATQRDDPATTFSAYIQHTEDGGATWLDDIGMVDAVGGQTNPKTGLPVEFYVILARPLANTTYRGRLVLPMTLDIGVEVQW